MQFYNRSSILQAYKTEHDVASSLVLILYMNVITVYLWLLFTFYGYSDASPWKRIVAEERNVCNWLAICSLSENHTKNEVCLRWH